MRRRDLLKPFAWAACAAAIPGIAMAAAVADATDATWSDTARGRDLPVRVRWPAGDGSCGVVFFSHGLGGNLDAGAFWAQAWQAAGLAVVNLQHPGSDAAIWHGGLAAVRQAAGPAQYVARIGDAHFALDELDRRRRTDPAWRRARLDAVGFCGHSFGARLTQAVAGESPPQARRYATALRARDPRPRAFIAFSPGFDGGASPAATEAEERFGQIERPFLCVTGARDEAMIVGDATNAARRAVYGGLPPGRKAELVLAGADHMTFSGQAATPRRSALLRREPEAARLEPGHRAIVARITTDWWRWRLLGDAAAGERLAHPTGLAPDDTWQQG